MLYCPSASQAMNTNPNAYPTTNAVNTVIKKSVMRFIMY